MTARYRLYGAEVSYFTAKVRPALRAKGVPFTEILATPSVFRDVILPRTGLAFIPVVTTPDGETWQDTSEILDRLEARVPEPALAPPGAFLRVAAALLEVYADEFLILPAMHYRWSFPESEAKARADFAATIGDPAAASRFADRMKGSIAMLGVTPLSAPAIEAHTRDLLDRLETLFAATPFLLGERLSVADCALLGPLYAHLYLDAVPGRLLRKAAPRVCHWTERCNHPDPDAVGTWLDGVRAVVQWADTAPRASAEVPRGVGSHETRLRDAVLSRYTSPYTLWMLQRPLAAYAALSADERARVDRLLASTGLDTWLAYRPRHRLAKREFKLILEA